MKTPNIQNIFKMMIGTSALIASIAFFINTISPVQASENKLPTTERINTSVVAGGHIYVGCGKGIYSGDTDASGYVRNWYQVSL